MRGTQPGRPQAHFIYWKRCETNYPIDPPLLPGEIYCNPFCIANLTHESGKKIPIKCQMK